MTTIAYRAGVLAADGKMVNGHAIVGLHTRKIRRLADGRLMAVCGDFAVFDPAVAWVEGRGPRPDFEEHTGFLVIGTDGSVTKHERFGSFEVHEPFFAMGSGKDAALAAMHCGACAAKAVQIAELVDPWTGGETMILRLET